MYKGVKNDVNVLLVGDSKLGGVAVTISSLEALSARGFNVSAVVFAEGGDGGGLLDNQNCVQDWIRSTGTNGKCFSLPTPPEMDEEKEGGDLWEYFDSDEVKKVLRGIEEVDEEL